MRILQSIDLSEMKSRQLIKFFNGIAEEIKAVYGTETCDIAVDFLHAAMSYELTVNGCSAEESESLQQADDAADDAWGALNDQIRASLRHPNPVKRNAAASVFMIFAEFSNPTRLNYTEEYAVIRKQLDELKKLPRETLKLALIDEHIDALEKCYADFQKTIDFVQDGSKRPNLCKQAKAEAFKSYSQFAETLNVLVRINSDERYARIVDAINGLIEKSK